MSKPACPDIQKLQDLLAEKLDANTTSDLSAHVEGCSDCQKTLEGLSPMSRSWADVLGAFSNEEPLPEAGLERVLKNAGVAEPETTQDVVAQESSESAHSKEEDRENMTEADFSKGDGVDALDLLQPSTKPGSLGQLGHYEVLEVLGQGGFGVVVRAFDEKLQRVVAIKLMSPQLAATSPARKRFLREARASAKVRHENVVQIYAVEEKPIPHLVMEYIPGRSLQQKLDETGPLETPEMLRLAMQIARGLAAAHAQGLIHRDIKPGNILLEESLEPHAKITDFGLARAADDASLTQSGVVAGTPMYMAPEQAEGKAIDQRADLFSLGSVYYVMLSGRPPFRASGTMAVLKRVCEDAPRPIREIIPEVPEWLCDIISKLHAKKPEGRYQTAKEVADLLAQRLADVQAGREIVRVPSVSERVEAPMPIPATQPLTGNGAPRRRWRIVAALGVIALLVVGLFVSPFLYRYLTDQGTLTYSGTIDPNIDRILIKRDGEVVADLITRHGTVQLPAGDYEAEVVVKDGRELAKYRVGPFSHLAGTPGALGWQKPVGRTFPLTLTRDFHVGISLELAKLPDPSKPPTPDPGWVQLFNGKDLTGWQGNPDMWQFATDGVLIGKGDGVGLTLKKELQDFHLRLQTKLASPGRSHIKFRSTKTPAWTACEAVLHHNTPGRRAGALLLFQDAKPGGEVLAASDRVAPKDWFTVEVIAVGKKATVKIDGVVTAERVVPELAERGKLALSILGQDTVVHFRKIEIKELPPEEPGWVQLFNGKDFDGWERNDKWQVVNGILTTKGPATLYSKNTYRDFHCRVKARSNAASIGFRAGNESHGEVTIGNKWPHNAKTGSFHLWIKGKPSEWAVWKQELVTPGNWFDMDVKVQGNKVVVKVNGTTTANFESEKMLDEGLIALGASEAGTLLEISKIEIKELPAVGSPPRAVAPFDAKKAKEHQDAWAKHLGVNVEIENAIGMKLRLMPPGQFLMGYTQEQIEQVLPALETEFEKARARATAAKSEQVADPFYLGVHEVTREQFRRFVKESGYRTTAERDGKGGQKYDHKKKEYVHKPEYIWSYESPGVTDQHPVVFVSREDAEAFCSWLSKRDGRTYALPTETQWEYACRAGTTTLWWPGDKEEEVPKSERLNGVAPNKVGSLSANPFGLYDMHGNVSEWVRGAEPFARRGGYAGNRTSWAHSALRVRTAADTAQSGTGFRVALVVGDLKAKAAKPEAFVILAKDKRAESRHATLADAVKAAQSGDTIEIRGDGPFVSNAITIDDKSLVIRAGTGFTPVLRLGTHDLARPTFFRVRSPVVLEGLDLQMVDIDPYDDQKRNSAVLLHATGTSSRVLNCRFTVYRRGDEKSKGHNCHSIGGDGNCQFDVRNCLQIGRSFFHAEMASDTNVILDNCLVNAHIAIAPILTERLKNARLSVRNCTWAGLYPIRFLLTKDKTDRLTGTMDLEVSSSVLLAGFVVAQTDTSSLAAAEYEKRFRAAVRFQEDRNLYSLRSKATFFDITAGFNKMLDHKPRETLNEWEEFWGLKKTGSIQAQARFKNYDPASGKGGLMPDDYRLAPGSPGKGAGLGGKDLGADVDLVGPGAAYERWRQTSAYQEWRKKSDALMD